MVKCDQKSTSSLYVVEQCALPCQIPRSITESDEAALQADKQHSVSRTGQVWSGRLIGVGTQWLEGNCLGLGTSVWHASHSTSHLQPKSDLSS